jgi:hypothetical protein
MGAGAATDKAKKPPATGREIVARDSFQSRRCIWRGHGKHGVGTEYDCIEPMARRIGKQLSDLPVHAKQKMDIFCA